MRIRVPRQITPQQAITLQRKLAPLVNDCGDLPSDISTIVGCDATYFNGRTVAAAVSVGYDDLSVRRVKVAEGRTVFPYIPGLLAFREGGAVLRVIRALRLKSYVCLVDGHGLAHPRRFGLACFVGLALDRPTIGVAKSLLCGSVDGSHVVDAAGCAIAEIVPLPRSGKLIYVSVGHKISLRNAVQVVRHCVTPQGPLPIRLAHEEVTKRKWQLKRSNRASS